MKILLYGKNQKIVAKSGVGRAMVMQKESLEQEGIEVTLDPRDSYDIVHLNTIFPSDLRMAKEAKKLGKKVVYHAHSTEEDFRNSFTGSNLVAPLFKLWIKKCYATGDLILTPTEYSKKLLKNYGITNPIEAISNGVDTGMFQKNLLDRESFRKQYGFKSKDKVIMSVGLYFERKGILDFVEMAKKMPKYKFIWFGYTPSAQIPKKIRQAVQTKLPNLTFAGYVNAKTLQQAYNSCDLFFFPSHEETEGIVVLEALSSKIPVLLREIPVYDDWLVDQKDVYKGRTQNDFYIKIHQIMKGEVKSLVDRGRSRAIERDVICQARRLCGYYKQVANT